MEHAVLSLNHEVYIEVRDRDPMITEMIGSARVPLRFFCIPAGLTEWIELFFMGMPAGRIQLRSEYFPEMMIGGGINTTTIIMEPGMGMGGMGGGGMGGGGGMMKGAMMGAMIATDVAIMEHESHNNRHHNTRVVVVENNGRRH